MSRLPFKQTGTKLTFGVVHMRHSVFASAVGLSILSSAIATNAGAEEPGYFVGPDGSIQSTDQGGYSSAASQGLEAQILGAPEDFSMPAVKPPLAMGAAPMSAYAGGETQYQVSADGTITESGGYDQPMASAPATPYALPTAVLADSMTYASDAPAPMTYDAAPAPMAYDPAQNSTNTAYYDIAPTTYATAPMTDDAAMAPMAYETGASDFGPMPVEVATQPAPAMEYAAPAATEYETMATVESLAPQIPELGLEAEALPLETTSAGARYDLGTHSTSFDYGTGSTVEPMDYGQSMAVSSAPMSYDAPPMAQVVSAEPGYAGLTPAPLSGGLAAESHGGGYGPVYDDGAMSGMQYASRGDGGYGQATVTLSAEGPAAQTVRGWVGRSTVVTLPAEAAEVIVSDPNVARVILRTARQSVIVGLKPGSADISYFDDDGNQIANLDLGITFDLRALRATLERAFPNIPVALQTLPSGELVVEAVAPSPSEAASIRSIVQRYLIGTASAAGIEFEDSELPIVDRVRVATDDQVLVKVRIAEMRRSVVKQFGVDFNVASNSAIAAGISNPAFASPFETLAAVSNGFGTNGSVLGGIAARIAGQFEGADFGGLVQAFEQHNVMRVLAEPTLTAITGETASFLAGGEFPYPSSVDDGQIGVTYRNFGVALEFTPVVLDGGRISLTVATEISELTNEGALDIGGVSVPGIAVRRANTTVELPSGGTMSIAGLLMQRDAASHSGLPGLKNVPVVGQLFSSTDYLKNESELVILVTPYLVRPNQEREFRLPTDGFAPASDYDLFLLGRLNKVYGSGDVSAKAARTALKSPLGFIVN